MLNGVLTVHVPKKGDAYLAGTVHVAKEVQTIQRYQLEPYMSEKRVKPESATVHVAKCFPILSINRNTIGLYDFVRMFMRLPLLCRRTLMGTVWMSIPK